MYAVTYFILNIFIICGLCKYKTFCNHEYSFESIDVWKNNNKSLCEKGNSEMICHTNPNGHHKGKDSFCIMKNNILDPKSKKLLLSCHISKSGDDLIKNGFPSFMYDTGLPKSMTNFLFPIQDSILCKNIMIQFLCLSKEMVLVIYFICMPSFFQHF